MQSHCPCAMHTRTQVPGAGTASAPLMPLASRQPAPIPLLDADLVVMPRSASPRLFRAPLRD